MISNGLRSGNQNPSLGVAYSAENVNVTSDYFCSVCKITPCCICYFKIFFLNIFDIYYKLCTVCRTVPWDVHCFEYFSSNNIQIHYEFCSVCQLLHRESAQICKRSRFFLGDLESVCIERGSFSRLILPFCMQCRTR